MSLPAAETAGHPATVLPVPLPPHPRLYVPKGGWEKVRASLRTDPINARIHKTLQIKAEQFLGIAPLEREMEGRRLLNTSRRALMRITTLGAVARVDGDERFTQRAIAELMAVAAFTDWNQSHFLDVAEMSLAVAIGYEWLYDDLTPDQRGILTKALIEKAIVPSYVPEQAWHRSSSNWAQVCHAGLSAAAIVIADIDPELAERTLQRALDGIEPSASVYAPDGAYPEGPMYWSYGTQFHVALVDALKQFTGNCHGLDRFPGFAESADYMQQVTDPRGKYFSYFDCRESRSLEFTLFWFATHYGRADWESYEVNHLESYLSAYDLEDESYHFRLLALALFWRIGEVDPVAAAGVRSQAGPGGPPTSWMAQGREPIAFFRSKFDDPKALYAAIKGGSPTHSHGHMDAGSFIINADGVRWALDLGMEEYFRLENMNINLWQGGPDGLRWRIFRLGPDSHNILRFNGEKQQFDGKSELVRYAGTGARPHAVFELDALYPEHVSGVRRGLALLENRAFLLQDEWIADAEPVEVAWQWLTAATVKVEGNTITLSQAGETLQLDILEPAQFSVDVVDNQELLQPYDAPNPGVSRISILMRTAPGAAGRLRVLAVPGSTGSYPAPALEPLESWSGILEPLDAGEA